MNAVRFESLYQGLNAVAQRVSDATPISESWAAAKVLQELRRQGRNVSLSEVTGCLNTLKQAGLVRETKGEFCRVSIEKKADQATQNPKLVAALSARLATVMGMIGEITSDLEAAALDIEAQVTEGDEEVQKMRQLKSLIASIR